MTQINNTPPTDGGAAGVNLLAIIVAVVVLLGVAWFFYTGGFNRNSQPAPATDATQPTVVAPTVQP